MLDSQYRRRALELWTQQERVNRKDRNQALQSPSYSSPQNFILRSVHRFRSWVAPFI
ncbi:hypothetical protein [Salinithrix halophila]|uniref:Uncharacterized protein n=1 Tax=Salinithrix halophila TaxID=1485204 RepID=A0ABV8JJ51_9BACL